MIANMPTAGAEFMLSGEAEDMARDECMRLAIQRAFPLPSTGAFTDLLAAIDSGPADSAEAISARR